MSTVTSPARTLPAGLTLGAAELGVADLGRSIPFYENVVGLRVRKHDGGTVELGGEGGDTVIRLVEEPGAKPFPGNAAGLFHVAILLPERRDLAVTLSRLMKLGVLTGASDHLVSEALYLEDPDGNGLEIYRDRARAEWPYDGGQLRMATEAIDGRGLLGMVGDGQSLDAPAPAGTVVGHVHMQAGDLDVAQKFWIDTLGFELTTTYPGALFMSAGGYHHHIAANVWRAKGRGPAPEGHAGLRSIEIRLPEAADVAALGDRVEASGAAFERTADGLSVTDPYGTLVVIRV